MKKYLYSIVFAALILMGTPVVNASNEVYYINRNNIEMTETEYNNLLGLGFSESYIDSMDMNEFLANKDIEGTVLSEAVKFIKTSTIMRNGITIKTTEEITEEEARELQSHKIINRDPAGNYYDGMIMNNVILMTTKIVGLDDEYMRFMNTIEWLVLPSNKHHDIIGIGFDSSLVQFGSIIVCKQEWVDEEYVHGFDYTCAPKYVNTGGLAVIKLPDVTVQSLESNLYFNVMKQNGAGTITSLYAVGDYAHAVSDVTPTNLLSHISVNDSSGIIIDATYASYFEAISPAVAAFIGTW